MAGTRPASNKVLRDCVELTHDASFEAQEKGGSYGGLQFFPTVEVLCFPAEIILHEQCAR